MSATTFYFWLLASITGLCAVAVVVSQNIVRAAAYLLFTLAGTAGIFFLLGADFVGATQLIVYVGGILVLVVFGVMLTAQGPFITMKTGAAEWAISAAVGLLLLAVLAVSLLQFSVSGAEKPAEPPIRLAHGNSVFRFDSPDSQKPAEPDPATSRNSIEIGKGFLGWPVGPAQREAEREGNRGARTSYLLPFEIVSVHLLVVLIGAAYLARAKRRRQELRARSASSALIPGP
jgi:NADH-quinone oxidoreductase subunit J